MTDFQIVSLVVFAGIIGVSIIFKVNVGIVAFPVAYLVAFIGGIGVTKLLSSFPADLVLLIIGVTLLFAHVQYSGAIDWMIRSIMRVIGPRRWPIPWIGFVLAAILGTVGGLPAAVVAIVIPIVAKIAKTHQINYFMMAVITNWAAIAAGMSPLSPAGALLVTLTRNMHLPYSPWALYGIVMAVNFIVSIIIFLAFGGARVWRKKGTLELATTDIAIATTEIPAEADRGISNDRPREDADQVATASATSGHHTVTPYQIASLSALVALVVTVVGFGFDIGLTALGLAVILQIIFRPPEKEMLNRITWPVVLLLAGLLTYLAVLEQLGAVHSLEVILRGITPFSIALLALAYVTVLISNVDSSTVVVLGALVPVGLAIAGHSEMAVLAVLAMVATVTAIVSMSPVHIDGSLIIANTPNDDGDQLYRKLIYLTIGITIVMPGLMAIYPIVVGK